MGHIDGKLVGGEQVVFRTKLHAAVLVFPLIGLAIIAAFLGFAGIGVLLSLMVACWLAVELANHGISEFAVTNKPVLMKRGYLPRKIMDNALEEVEEIQVSQSALGKKMGYGTLVVRGIDGSRHSFASLNQPVEFGNTIQERLGRAKCA
jgi:hypothetical protein